jgi:hypothetical protein
MAPLAIGGQEALAPLAIGGQEALWTGDLELHGDFESHSSAGCR